MRAEPTPLDRAARDRRRPTPWVRVAAVALAVGLVVPSSVFVIRGVVETQRDAIAIVAALKATHVEARLTGHLADFRTLGEAAPLHEIYGSWREGDDLAARDLLFERLLRIRDAGGFTGIALIDATGTVVWSSDDPADGDSVGAQPTIVPLPVTDRAPTGAAGLRVDDDGHVHLAVSAPLSSAVVAPSPSIVARSDAGYLLSAELAAWPTPSRTGRVVLFRLDGDRITGLERDPDDPSAAPLTWRASVGDPLTVASQVAASPDVGPTTVDGRDHRGVRVLASGRRIAGTDWFVVAQVDRHDALASIPWLVAAALAVAAITTAAGSAALGSLGRRERIAAALSAERAQVDRLRTLQLLQSVTDASPDAVFAKDRDGRYLLCNRAAADVVGRATADVLGQDDLALFPNETAERIRAEDRQVLETGRRLDFEHPVVDGGGTRHFLTTRGR